MTETMQTEFRTAKGNTIRLFIATETPNLADHTIMNPCWDLMVSIGDRHPVTAKLVDDPQYGLCIGRGSLGDAPFIVPVPASSADDVRSVAREYSVEVERCQRIADEIDEKYATHTAAVRSMMIDG